MNQRLCICLVYAAVLMTPLLFLNACSAASTTISENQPVLQDTASDHIPTITVTMTNAPEENAPEEQARFEQLIQAFQQQRPDVQIDARRGGWDKETFVAKLTADTMEDAYLVPITEPQDLINHGYAADITDILEQWEHFASLNPTVLQLAQDESGRIYGIPASGFAQGLIYNRKLFQEVGLDPDTPPQTWDEVREYAKQLTDRNANRAGFVVLSKDNQGGWQFTAWVYSFGGTLQQQQDSQWVATFDDPAAIEALQTIQAMRWEDQTLTEQQLLAVSDILPLLANEQVAMAILAPDALRSLKTQFEANIDDFGFGALPQSGGNATYIGGAIWMFNPQSSPEVLQAAVEWTLFRDFNLQAFEDDLKTQRERDQLVGWPQLPIFTGSFQQQRDDLIAAYANAPIAQYQPYLEADLALRTAPPIEAQQVYATLDTVLQAVLTDPNADPEQLLHDASTQFQRQVLDPIQDE